MNFIEQVALRLEIKLFIGIKMKHVIRKCHKCGGEVTLDEYDEIAGTAKLTEIHKKNCPALLEVWGNAVGSHGTL